MMRTVHRPIGRTGGYDNRAAYVGVMVIGVMVTTTTMTTISKNGALLEARTAEKGGLQITSILVYGGR